MSDTESEPAQPPAAFQNAPGHLGGRYALGELVGAGASACVYRARDERLARDVAVKLYPPGVVGPDRARQQQELAVLSQLHHKNLVELLDAGEQDGRAYLVMHLIEDPTLADRLILGGPMSPGEVAHLGAELGDALAYVHERGITHRDVKPANVLVGDRPMLADFGIARLVDAARVTQTGYLIGTLAFLAPEQVSGGEVGTPCDVYALGLTLLEALTGMREYDGDGPEAAFARLSRTPSVPEGLPVLTDLLREMTALDPATRPSAADCARRLRSALPELEAVAPDQWPPVAPAAGFGPGTPGTPGTKVLQVAAQPAGLTGRSEPLVAAETRHVRRRRLLAGALGATGLAAAVVAFLTMQTTSAAVPVPAMSVPTPLIGESGPQVATPVAQLPAPPPQAPMPGPGAGSPGISASGYGSGSGGSAPRDSAVGDSGKQESRRSGKHSRRSDSGQSSSGGNDGSSSGASDSGSAGSGGSSGSGGSDSGGSGSSGSGSSGSGTDSGASGSDGSGGGSSTDSGGSGSGGSGSGGGSTGGG